MPLFSDASMAETIEAQLRLSDREGATQTHAWVVMPDHLHWMFTLCTDDLSSCLRRFKSRSARAVNQLRPGGGLVWQAGFYDHRLRDEDDMVVQAQYIIDNPLRRRLVANVHQYPHWGCQWISNCYPNP